MSKLRKIFVLIAVLLLAACTTTSKGEYSNVVGPIGGTRDDLKYDDFNEYLFTELGLEYTPTFVIIDKDNKITYFDDGELTNEEFKAILKSIEAGTQEGNQDNIGKEMMEVDFIQKGKVNVLEIVWTNCSHCEIQIKENNPEIFESNKDLVFIEYFPLDTQELAEEFVK